MKKLFTRCIFSCFGLLLLGSTVHSQAMDDFNTLRDFGLNLEDANKLDSALTIYEAAARIAEKNKSDYDKITIYTDIAIVQRKRSNYISSKNNHLKALKLAEKNQDKEMVEVSYHGLGCLYENTGDYEKAVEYYLNALRMTRERGDQKGAAVTLQNISKTYMQFNFKEMALEHINQAMGIAAEAKNDSLMANVLHDQGEILAHFGEVDAALLSLNEALKTYEKLNYRRYIASSLVYLGDTYSRMNEPQKTLQYFERAMAYKEEMDQFVLADLYYKTGCLRKERKEFDKANFYFRKSHALAKTGSFKDLQQKTAWELYKSAQARGETKTALAYLGVSSSLRDSIFNVDSAKRIAELQLKYDNERQQRELQALRLEQNQLILFFAVLFFVGLIGFLVYFTRMTAQNNAALKAKNEEILSQNLQLTESNELLRQYAYVAAHDLKEPLRTICSFVNLLEIKFTKRVEDPQAIEYMQFISNSAKRMNLLLSDLLEYSSVFHEKPGHDPVEPQAVLKDVSFNLRTLIENKGAVVDFQGPFPNLIMNRLHMMQIFQNLIGNALKFTNGKHPRVEVRCKTDEKEVTFSVKDNGVGISEEHREKIFQLFFRAFSEKEFEGTGIGLSICKSLTEKYGGRIWFQSIEGQGTTFFFTIPTSLMVEAGEVQVAVA